MGSGHTGNGGNDALSRLMNSLAGSNESVDRALELVQESLAVIRAMQCAFPSNEDVELALKILPTQRADIALDMARSVVAEATMLATDGNYSACVRRLRGLHAAMLLWRHVEREDDSDFFPASQAWDGNLPRSEPPTLHSSDIRAIAEAVAEEIKRRQGEPADRGSNTGETDAAPTIDTSNAEDPIPF